MHRPSLSSLLSAGVLLVSVCGCCTVPQAAVTFHPTTAMVRIAGADGAAVPPRADSYAIEMVRNEREGIQFAVLPMTDRRERVGRICVDIESPGAPAATLYQVLPVEHTAPPTTGQFVVPPRRLGPVPDVLMPVAVQGGTDVPGARPGNVPLTYYLEFAATAQTQPGTYLYRVRVRTGKVRDKSLHVRVTVKEPVLPDRLPFRTATTWNWTLEEYFGRALTAEEKRVYWNFCLDHRLSPCTFFARSPDPAPADLPALKERGLSVINVLFVGGKKPRPLSAEFKAKVGPQLRQWREQLRAIGMERDAVILAADEPEEAALEVCRENVRWLKEQFPEAKVWIATRPSPGWAEFTDLFDPVMAWSTDFYKPHAHTDEAMRWWKQANPRGEYWWFHSVEPYAPYTNVRLDNLPIEGRIAGWQSALYGVDGYEYVWITDWKANKESRDVPWPQRAAQWKTGMSGTGTLCYPDERMRPMPSLRLVNLRDGLEDWALIEMLVPRDDAAGRRRIAATVTRDLADYSTDPEALLKARGQLIERLSRAKGQGQ